MIYTDKSAVELHKLIKHIMIDSDIQQSDIALKMNKSKQSISNLLKQDNYTLNTLYQLCNALDCDLHIDITIRK